MSSVKKFNDFIKEGKYLGYSYFSDREEQEYVEFLSGYKSKNDTLINELDKIWNRLSSLNIEDIYNTTEETFEEIQTLLDEMETNALLYHDEIYTQAEKIEDEEKSSNISMVSDDYYTEFRDKYEVVEDLLQKIVSISTIDASKFKNNSARIQLEKKDSKI